MQLFQDELLQLVGCFSFLSVDAGLGKQRLRADFGLGQQQPETDVFRRQKPLGRQRTSRRHIGSFPVMVGFKHRQGISPSVLTRG
jgi:hypothetical protein